MIPIAHGLLFQYPVHKFKIRFITGSEVLLDRDKGRKRGCSRHDGLLLNSMHSTPPYHYPALQSAGRTTPSASRKDRHTAHHATGTLHHLRRPRRGRSHQPAAAAPPYQQRSLTRCRHDVARRPLLVARRGVPRRRSSHRLLRRHHGALCLRHHAPQRRRGRTNHRKQGRLPRRLSRSRRYLLPALFCLPVGARQPRPRPSRRPPQLRRQQHLRDQHRPLPRSAAAL